MDAKSHARDTQATGAAPKMRPTPNPANPAVAATSAHRYTRSRSAGYGGISTPSGGVRCCTS